jgi:hydroxymethylpyrimidine/phosphomethylpyrimidine kinase
VNIALTIAGSDSGGGAGIQADLKTFHQFGVYGTTVVAAVTAQNTQGVTAVHTIPADLVAAQFAALADDIRPDACKSGMLGTAELVRTVAAALARHGFGNYVLDPVMVATSGDRLLDADAEQAVAESLVPLATVVTPNLDEATILVQEPVDSVERMERAGRDLVSRGAQAALIKGGHLGEQEIVDVLVTATGVRRFTHAKVHTTSTHGTGCTLSAAITAGLASGKGLHQAVADGLDFVHVAIATAPGIGAGHGPLNHFAPSPPYPPGFVAGFPSPGRGEGNKG